MRYSQNNREQIQIFTKYWPPPPPPRLYHARPDVERGRRGYSVQEVSIPPDSVTSAGRVYAHLDRAPCPSD